MAERLRRVGWRFPSFPLFLWDNKTNPTSRHVLSPAEIAEIAERASQRGMKISFISFISSTSEAAKPMTAGQKTFRMR
ncbi:MAG: hypothetical protein SPL50_05855 [Alloprevotella sp.]|nr:hypothetical protein [Alloprevotella sp.]